MKLNDGFILLEQNPKKASRWARQARQGHRIAWLMPNYRAVVVNGEVRFLR